MSQKQKVALESDFIRSQVEIILKGKLTVAKYHATVLKTMVHVDYGHVEGFDYQAYYGGYGHSGFGEPPGATYSKYGEKGQKSRIIEMHSKERVVIADLTTKERMEFKKSSFMAVKKGPHLSLQKGDDSQTYDEWVGKPKGAVHVNSKFILNQLDVIMKEEMTPAQYAAHVKVKMTERGLKNGKPQHDWYTPTNTGRAQTVKIYRDNQVVIDDMATDETVLFKNGTVFEMTKKEQDFKHNYKKHPKNEWVPV